MPLTEHLNAMTATARRLQLRGTEVVFLDVPDVEPFAALRGSWPGEIAVVIC